MSFFSPEFLDIAGDFLRNVGRQVQENPEKAKSAILLIYKIFKYLPKYRGRAKAAFKEIWNSGNIAFSTYPDFIRDYIDDVKLPDARWEKLYNNINDDNKILILIGIRVSTLIERGLHPDAESTKEEVMREYGNKGLKIVNIITTNDIDILLREIESVKNKKVSNSFSNFLRKYDKISFLISPKDLKNKKEIEGKIRKMSCNQEFLIINMCGTQTQVLELSRLVNDMIINGFKAIMEPHIKDSGFKKSIKIILTFK